MREKRERRRKKQREKETCRQTREASTHLLFTHTLRSLSVLLHLFVTATVAVEAQCAPMLAATVAALCSARSTGNLRERRVGYSSLVQCVRCVKLLSNSLEKARIVMSVKRRFVLSLQTSSPQLSRSVRSLREVVAQFLG